MQVNPQILGIDADFCRVGWVDDAWDQRYKTFYSHNLQMFVSGKLLQPSLLFVGNVRSLPEWSTFSFLPFRENTWLDFQTLD